MKVKIKIKDYKFNFESKDLENKFKDKIVRLNGKYAILELKNFYKKRSDNQNQYYWGVVLQIISEETGNDLEDLHSTFKAMFLVDRTGVIPIIKSTAKLTTIEFNDYINRIVLFVSQRLNLEIPEPVQKSKQTMTNYEKWFILFLLSK